MNEYTMYFLIVLVMGGCVSNREYQNRKIKEINHKCPIEKSVGE